MPLPRMALTLGDVAGIGPEVIVRAWLDPQVHACCLPFVVGEGAVVARAVQLVGAPLTVQTIAEPAAARPSPHVIPCWNPSGSIAGSSVAAVPAGANDVRAGQAAYDYLVAAARAALAGTCDAICTAPLSKAALSLAGLSYPGHTEILAHECDVHEFAMMLYLPAECRTPSFAGHNAAGHNSAGQIAASQAGLGVAHVTLHTSIQSVPGLLTTDGVLEKIRLVDQFMRRVGVSAPRIGVCALNPHAGEDRLFGDEESRIVYPAVQAAVAQGIDASGPIPADALLRRACAGSFDGVVAMYHDQGHIALKLVGGNKTVNVTLGLPIVRTSPSHGTAFDIAWKGLASAEGIVEAIRVAALLAKDRTAC